MNPDIHLPESSKDSLAISPLVTQSAFHYIPPMPDEKPSVLITGANGFVGARLCHRFLMAGFRVIAGVRKTSDLSSLGNLNVEYRYGDITQPETLKEMVTRVDYIVHNAGLIKARRREAFFLVNEQGTLSLFEATLEHNPDVRKVLYISSLAAAGPSSTGRPVTENDPPRPITTYGQSKLAGEGAASDFSKRLNVVVIRPPGVYGPGDREIFSFFKAIHRRLKPCIGDMARRLQLVHVDDLCLGIFLALTSETKSGEVYFIAENRSYSMKELIELLEKACGKKAFPVMLPAVLFKSAALFSEWAFALTGGTPMLTREKANELLSSWEVATDKAKRDIGFESRIPFEQGARETYQWYRRSGWLK